MEQSNDIANERYNIVKKKRYDNVSPDGDVYELFNEYEKPLLDVMNEAGTTVGSYSSFVGSPMSKGVFQFDMWKVTPSDRYDWNLLKIAL